MNSLMIQTTSNLIHPYLGPGTGQSIRKELVIVVKQSDSEIRLDKQNFRLASIV